MMLDGNRDGRDNSDSLLIQEQNKALPVGLELDSEQDAARSDFEAQVLEATGRGCTDLLQLTNEAERQGKDFLTAYVNGGRERAIKAYQSEHAPGSKYFSPRYRQRSKIFKPKTRQGVRKAQAAAAAALFASADTVIISAQDESSPTQRASADLKKELLNYRLDRHGPFSIPWFMTSMGAHQDAWISRLCVTKQFWLYKERVLSWTSTGSDEGGDVRRVPDKTQVVVDRPECLNIRPENVIFDPTCDWRRPAQSSGYLILRFPMTRSELRAKMKDTPWEGGERWAELSEQEIAGLSSTTPDDARTTQAARTGGYDGDSQRHGAFAHLWVYEVFMHLDGEDYCWWQCGNKVLSVPRPTYDAYPEQAGERPVVIGVGALEAHNAMPMSHVESWQPIQQETNEIVNLRIDQLRHVVSPAKRVRRGRQVDLRQLNEFAPDNLIMLQDPHPMTGDVIWDRPPDVPGSARAEADYLANDLDELAGNFSTSSVMQNRGVGDTVGGMKLAAGAAGSVAEFDLRCWIETWAEPTVTQLVRLEEFYESDEKILAMAGQKAELIEKYGLNEITDHLLMEQVHVKVNVGLGSADPMQKLAKLQQAAQMVGETVTLFLSVPGFKPPLPNMEEFTDEVFGAAGFKNAFKRFFTPPEAEEPQGPPPPDPAIMAKLQADMAKLEATMADKDKQRAHDAEQNVLAIKKDVALKQMDLQGKAALQDHSLDRQDQQSHVERQFGAQEKQADRQHSERTEQAGRLYDAIMQIVGAREETQRGESDRQHQAQEAARSRFHESRNANAERSFQDTQARASEGFQSQEKAAERDHSSKQADADRQARAKEAAARAKAGAAKPQPKKAN